ncbi:MAG: MarR family transcriptional regulator [Pseudomonadota bacterium]
MTSYPDDLPIEFVRECVLLSRKWRARVDEKMKASGMTLARSTVLYWVNEMPEGTSQREIADVVGVEGPTLVRLLHALESQGLIERVAIASDRRAKAIRLTAAAFPLLDEINRVAAETSREFLGGLEKRRLPSATRLAREAREALE